MKTTRITLLIQFLLSLLPIVYLMLIWHQLPDSVPLHYSGNKADRMGSRMELGLALGFMTVVSIGVSALLLNIHKIDPKKSYSSNSSLMQKIAWTTVTLMSLLGVYAVYETLTYCNSGALGFSGKGYLVLLSLTFVVLGNFLNNVKPNYFVGIRTPWNLENEENWRKTHYLAAKLMFYGGIVIMLVILALPAPISYYALTLGLIPIVLIPFAYSYLLYKREKQ